MANNLKFLLNRSSVNPSPINVEEGLSTPNSSDCNTNLMQFATDTILYYRKAISPQVVHYFLNEKDVCKLEEMQQLNRRYMYQIDMIQDIREHVFELSVKIAEEEINQGFQKLKETSRLIEHKCKILTLQLEADALFENLEQLYAQVLLQSGKKLLVKEEKVIEDVSQIDSDDFLPQMPRGDRDILIEHGFGIEAVQMKKVSQNYMKTLKQYLTIQRKIDRLMMSQEQSDQMGEVEMQLQTLKQVLKRFETRAENQRKGLKSQDVTEKNIQKLKQSLKESVLSKGQWVEFVKFETEKQRKAYLDAFKKEIQKAAGDQDGLYVEHFIKELGKAFTESKHLIVMDDVKDAIENVYMTYVDEAVDYFGPEGINAVTEKFGPEGKLPSEIKLIFFDMLVESRAYQTDKAKLEKLYPGRYCAIQEDPAEQSMQEGLLQIDSVLKTFF